MLETFHKRLVSNTTLMEEIDRENMSDNIGKTTLLFKGEKFLFEPCNLAAWVLSVGLVEQPPVEVIAGLSVESNYFAFGLEKWL